MIHLCEEPVQKCLWVNKINAGAEALTSVPFFVYNISVRSTVTYMNKTYLIDSENVGDSWIPLLAAVAAEDEILVFYTQKSPHMSYKNLIALKASPVEPVFIECCEGNNALDFQLCTELGYRISQNAERDYAIVSNDNGFEAMVKYWRPRRIKVRRILGKACSAEIPSIAKPAASPKEEPAAETEPDCTAPEALPVEAPTVETAPAPAAEEPEKLSPAEAPAASDAQPAEESAVQESADSVFEIPDLAKEILFIVGKNNLQDLHESLQQLYDTKEAQAIYNAFKSDASYNAFLAKHDKMSLSEKQRAYCAIVFIEAAYEEPVPEDFPEFITAAWKKKKNLNSFRSLLQQQYGREKSERYYSLFKGHIKIIDKLK